MHSICSRIIYNKRVLLTHAVRNRTSLGLHDARAMIPPPLAAAAASVTAQRKSHFATHHLAHPIPSYHPIPTRSAPTDIY